MEKTKSEDYSSKEDEKTSKENLPVEKPAESSQIIEIATKKLPWYKSLFFDTKDLFKNPLFLMQVIGGLVSSWAMAVKSTFGQKYLEIQFDLTASEASKLKVYYIITLCLGFAIGGLVVKIGKLKALGYRIQKSFHLIKCLI